MVNQHDSTSRRCFRVLEQPEHRAFYHMVQNLLLQKSLLHQLLWQLAQRPQLGHLCEQRATQTFDHSNLVAIETKMPDAVHQSVSKTLDQAQTTASLCLTDSPCWQQLTPGYLQVANHDETTSLNYSTRYPFSIARPVQ
ncbi:unannotated protein [freshwater metagenome]|uniref:Unannotated protein n=1 Tax=freshwater metagenome TaxID=449393 RepID=A0A6J6YSW8_9ZZZZ